MLSSVVGVSLGGEESKNEFRLEFGEKIMKDVMILKGVIGSRDFHFKFW